MVQIEILKDSKGCPGCELCRCVHVHSFGNHRTPQFFYSSRMISVRPTVMLQRRDPPPDPRRDPMVGMELDKGSVSCLFLFWSQPTNNERFFITQMERNVTRATTTRPSLARILAAAGYELKPAKSIWDPSRFEWEFDLDKKSATIVSDFYTGIGKRPPKSIEKFLQKSVEADA